jgi:arginase family enzyme
MNYPSWDEIRSGHRFAGREIPMILPDMPSFMSQPIARTPDDLEGAGAVIIGAPYVANAGGRYAGVPATEWLAGPKRVRQQSGRYPSGYIQDLDIDVFERMKVVDFGDAEIPDDANYHPTAENILRAQAAVEAKVNAALDAGAVPIVIGQNSPCGSYAIAKPIAERTAGKVGMISLDTHWDSVALDRLTKDPRIAGSASWKAKTYEFHKNFTVENLVEIGERGMLERREIVDGYRARGIHFYPMWKIRTELGIEGLCQELRHAYDGTDAVYVHYDMDVLGGAGPAPGDILGDLAEPIGMTDYEAIRIAFETGQRGFTGASFICIPPGSAVVYRTIVYMIMFMLAGLALRRE